METEWVDGMATILIADDSADIRRLVRLTFDGRYALLAAEDGAEALELLRQHRPDVAILDVVMPALSGLQVCRLVRADPDLAAIRVIVISANASAEPAYDAGADRFIAKPFSPSLLLVAVDELVRSRVPA
jgi:CheY-like chemotaxis protein